MVIGLVGPCGSGKSTIRSMLVKQGYTVRHIAQEHSYVKDMWKRISNPDILIYLEVSFPNTIIRRKLNWTYADYQTQLDRLAHAKAHADLVIQTDNKTVDDVFDEIQYFLNQVSI
jgi:cytidylate kinase